MKQFLTDAQTKLLKDYGIYELQFLSDILSDLFGHEEIFGNMTISEAIDAVTNEMSKLRSERRSEKKEAPQ